MQVGKTAGLRQTWSTPGTSREVLTAQLAADIQ